MNRLRVGLIGCGTVAQRGHLPGLLRSRRVIVVALADSDSKNLAKTASRFGISKTFTDYRAMLDDKLDMVDICVPNHLHAEVAIDALKQGVHVLVEKPLATSVEDARRIVRTAEEQRLKLCEAKQWRYIPALRKAYEWYSRGKLGRLISIFAQWHLDVPLTWSHARWYYDREKSGGGIVSDIGIHLLDLMLLFGGPASRVSASGGDFLGTMGLDTSVQALLEFSGGGSGFLDVSWLAPYSKMLELVGTAGIATVNMQYYSAARVSHFRNPVKDLFFSAGTIARNTRRVITRDFFNPLPNLYADLIDDFADSIASDGPPPIPGEIAVRALELKEAIYKSIFEKRDVALA